MHCSKYIKGLLRVFILIAVFYLVSCAKHTLTTSWKSEAMSGVKLEDILIIGQSRHLTTRKIFESAFVEDLQAEQIKASPSFKVSEENVEPTREALLELIRKTEAKTVLVTRFVNRKKKTVIQDTVGRTPSTYEEPYGAFFDTPNPVSSSTKTYIYLESNIYDVASEQLLWSATARCKDPVMTRKYLSDITGLLVADMKAKGML